MRDGLDFLFEYQGITSDMLLWGVFLAVSVAAVIAWINRRFRGAFIRALLQAEAFDAASARTTEELGCDRSRLLSLALRRRGGALRALTVRVLPDEAGNPSAVRYYIPEHCLSKARALYGTTGSGFGAVVLTVLLFFVLVLLAVNLTGPLTSMIRWAFGVAQ